MPKACRAPTSQNVWILALRRSIGFSPMPKRGVVIVGIYRCDLSMVYEAIGRGDDCLHAGRSRGPSRTHVSGSAPSASLALRSAPSHFVSDGRLGSRLSVR